MNTAGCLGKIGYDSRSDARKARTRIEAKPGYVRGDPLQAYHCACGRFHLGRDKRAGLPPSNRTADHHAGSFKSKFARWKELTEE